MGLVWHWCGRYQQAMDGLAQVIKKGLDELYAALQSCEEKASKVAQDLTEHHRKIETKVPLSPHTTFLKLI
jgi:hypothetical protein